MKYFNKIPIWENKRRMKKLEEFRSLVINYFNHCNSIEFLELEEDSEAVNYRRLINLIIKDAYQVIINSGVSTICTVTPAPAIGGYVQNVEIVNNIFGLHKHVIPSNFLIDRIDQAIGVYLSDSKKSKLRTFNPFFYIGLLFEFVASIPFKLIGSIGFNRAKAEKSIWGRLLKGLFYLAQFAVAIITILTFLGFFKKTK